jgi:hypothetical protein
MFLLHMGQTYNATGYRYLGPPLKESSEFVVPYSDSRTLKEKMSEASSSRSIDASGRIDLIETCAIIFNRVSELPSLKKKIYVINIKDPNNSKLEVVNESCVLSTDYLTLQQVMAKKESIQASCGRKKRRKGWTNDFIYGQRIQ